MVEVDRDAIVLASNTYKVFEMDEFHEWFSLMISELIDNPGTTIEWRKLMKDSIGMTEEAADEMIQEAIELNDLTHDLLDKDPRAITAIIRQLIVRKFITDIMTSALKEILDSVDENELNWSDEDEP